jgi:Mn-dependent DtxR family transcriptional regulator
MYRYKVNSKKLIKIYNLLESKKNYSITDIAKLTQNKSLSGTTEQIQEMERFGFVKTIKLGKERLVTKIGNKMFCKCCGQVV